ncbi:MAG: SPFH domain-containing protein [Gemmatimonadales bacterium]|nr:SPFH domain-containing protein [Gemmatimonadales bacterium]
MIREREIKATPGLVLFLLVLGGLLATAYQFIQAAKFEAGGSMALWGVGWLVLVLLLPGFFLVNPNDAKVITLLGRYTGSVKQPGFWWVNPFTVKRKISLKVRNFETAKLKVNDNHANPIEIAAIVVWRVVETAEAMFEVDHYEDYVRVQSESAVRGLATTYPYDAHGEDAVSLSTHTIEVSQDLQVQVQERLAKAGVEVLETRISHLAYSPEIASAMLQRQQASAIIAARQKIVEGAVGMVEMALGMLAEKQIVELDTERKASMVSNLLVVLCSERGTQPVVNTGTLYG